MDTIKGLIGKVDWVTLVATVIIIVVLMTVLRR
jgi:hypothetical protein